MLHISILICLLCYLLNNKFKLVFRDDIRIIFLILFISYLLMSNNLK